MPKSKTDFTNFVDARPNYFPGQFLLEDDFKVEQKYLIDRQKYHRQSLHVSGLVEGLEVEVIKDKQEVQIKSGSAINSNGDLIILKKDTSFSQFAPLTNGELYISYKEEKQVKQQEDFTRWQEVPTIGFAATTPNEGVKLAKISIVNNVLTLDLTVRDYSGIFLPNATGNDLTLRSGGNANPNVAILNGSLTVTGTFTVNNKIAVLGNQKIEFSDTDITNNLKLQLWTGYGLGINDGTLFYAANGKHSWRDVNGANERMVLTTGDNGFLTVNGTGTSSFAGNLKVTGTITGKIDATNINSGVLAVDRIPDLSANKIASGTLTVDRIPNLPANKITAGTTTGNLTISGNLIVTGTITGNKITVPGNQKIEFTDADITNNLKLQLWTGYGLGINDGTLFYAANGKHSWRDVNGANERMVLTTGDNGFLTVNGTGTSSFAGNLRVSGAITPSVGNTESNGIMFPLNPGGGGGDAAWIRYWARSGEATTFEIGTSNDTDDHIALMPGAGNVGIGTTTPSAKLEVNGNLKVTGTITGNIDATNINSGVLDIARIPTLDITRMVIITGMIVMWSGDEISITTGWGLCNGQGGRPDLRGRFILGSGQGSGLTNRTKGMTGGVERYALTVAEMPTHNHGITDPGHAHNWTATRQEQGTDDKNYSCELSKGDTGAGDTMSKNTNVVTTGISIQNNGSGQAHENMPPFYVLAFIIKL